MENQDTIDPNQSQDDLSGQQSDQIEGNGDVQGDQGQSQETTEFLELSGVKVPADAFEKMARERYKDAFEAHENRSKWQAENTRKAMEIAEIRRKAEAYERLAADPRLQEQPKNKVDQVRQKYLDQFSKRWGGQYDPDFVGGLVDLMAEVAGVRSQESMNPLVNYLASTQEKQFLQSHPDVQPGSPEMNQISSLIQAGMDAEKAYEAVVWSTPEKRQQLINKEIEAAVKKRDEDAKRKLKQSRTGSQMGTRSKSKDFETRSMEIIDRMVG